MTLNYKKALRERSERTLTRRYCYLVKISLDLWKIFAYILSVGSILALSGKLKMSTFRL